MLGAWRTGTGESRKGIESCPSTEEALKESAIGRPSVFSRYDHLQFPTMRGQTETVVIFTETGSVRLVISINTGPTLLFNSIYGFYTS